MSTITDLTIDLGPFHLHRRTFDGTDKGPFTIRYRRGDTLLDSRVDGRAALQAQVLLLEREGLRWTATNERGQPVDRNGRLLDGDAYREWVEHAGPDQLDRLTGRDGK